MTSAEFAYELRASTRRGRMDIVRVLAPPARLPAETLFRKVLDAWCDPDVIAVVLQKGEA